MQEAGRKTNNIIENMRWEWVIAAGLAAIGLLMRVPYLALVPVFDDEVMQTVYAMSIAPGKFMPLVGNDSYAGPMFSYILAVCLRLFGSSPAAPRIISSALGALTAGLTYLLARGLGLERKWAALAGLLLAANPHNILIASHYAGSTYILPTFSTAFLAALALAVRQRSGGWLIAAGACLGLAMQATPAVALMLPGVGAWFLLQTQSRIGLNTRWPYLALLAFLIAYAPVIAYNVQNQFVGLTIAGNRSYVWMPATNAAEYAGNLGRLLLQLARQLSGVLGSDEAFRAIVGMPLVLAAWAVIGSIYAVRKNITLPLLAVGANVLAMAWASNYYWEASATRFTNHLTPLLAVAMAALPAAVSSLAIPPRRFAPGGKARAVAGILLVALSLWPLVPMSQYYARADAAGETNVQALAYFDEFARQQRGSRILVSDSPGSFNPPEYYLTAHRLPYTLLPVGRIMERLATGQEAGRVILFLMRDDVDRVSPQTDMAAWMPSDATLRDNLPSTAYIIADAQKVHKPFFVFTDVIPLGPVFNAMRADWADQLQLAGYELGTDKLLPNERFIVRVYWRALGPMPEGYVGFVHLVGPDGKLIAQDDHELGRGFYRTLVWQPGEVIRERYEWVMPQDAPPGEYTLRAGVYSFPSLKRLPLRSANVPAQDDAVSLGAVRLQP